MIIDDVIITVSAGNGGDGIVRFNKTKMSLGPTGGSGGNGGSVFLQGVSDLTALKQFRFKKDLKADNGETGKNQLHDGANAKDLVLLVPVGTIAKNTTSGQLFEITKIGETLLIAKGGRGGKGNFLFRSATNTTPMEAGKGKLGESFTMHLELKMIADVGFIGLPNVGKSSLLNELTRASAKVANYPFTTLEPNLGVYYELILADIPGLIEGASLGKGLGIKFLKHIERTKVLFHLIATDSQDPVADYTTVRKELEIYNPLLLEKPEYLFLSRSDVASDQGIKVIQQSFKKIHKEIVPISIIDQETIKSVKKILNTLIEEKNIAPGDTII
jgi:GTP-binding protein